MLLLFLIKAYKTTDLDDNTFMTFIFVYHSKKIKSTISLLRNFINIITYTLAYCIKIKNALQTIFDLINDLKSTKIYSTKLVYFNKYNIFFVQKYYYLNKYRNCLYLLSYEILKKIFEMQKDLDKAIISRNDIECL